MWAAERTPQPVERQRRPTMVPTNQLRLALSWTLPAVVRWLLQPLPVPLARTPRRRPQLRTWFLAASWLKRARRPAHRVLAHPPWLPGTWRDPPATFPARRGLQGGCPVSVRACGHWAKVRGSALRSLLE